MIKLKKAMKERGVLKGRKRYWKWSWQRHRKVANVLDIISRERKSKRGELGEGYTTF